MSNVQEIILQCNMVYIIVLKTVHLLISLSADREQTAESRAAEQQSSREGSVVRLFDVLTAHFMIMDL